MQNGTYRDRRRSTRGGDGAPGHTALERAAHVPHRRQRGQRSSARSHSGSAGSKCVSPATLRRSGRAQSL